MKPYKHARTHHLLYLLIPLGLLLFWPVTASAQQWTRGPYYDTNTEETIEGVVEDIAYVTPVRGRGIGAGVHLTVQKGDAAMLVYLGPQWYLSEQGKAFEKGETVTIVGSRVTIDGTEAVIAKEVTRGEETFVLRDDQGFPAWRGWRRGGQGQGALGMNAVRPNTGRAAGWGRGMGPGMQGGMGRGMGPGRGRGAGGWCRCCN